MQTKIPLRIIRIEDEGCHLLIYATINGKEATLLIDTGASRTVLDKNRIEKFIPEDEQKFEINEQLSTGLGTNTLPSEITVLSELQLGEKIIHEFQTAVLDLSHVNQTYTLLGFPAIDGVIGGELLKKHKAVINYGSKFLKLKL
jgi:Predicted aspartyl protease